jgi:glycosyltransferase involved in cell wall biosynthesis
MSLASLTVLMPVRDAGPYLIESLASLWRQTFRDFEVVAIDDGSTDGSGEALERARRRQRRLRVLRQPPEGLPAALNAGLALAGGDLVARQDADDRSHPERFALQLRWLRQRPEHSVVGCRVGLLPRGYRGRGMRRWVEWHNRLSSHEAMARESLVDSPLAHGTALIRRSALTACGGWHDRGWPEDLDLWLRLLAAGARFGKVPRVLYSWRQHEASATRRDPRYRQEAFDALRMEALGLGLLRDRARLTLIGVGASLQRWHDRLSRAAYHPTVRSIGRPPSQRFDLEPPALLVFGAPAARARWRASLKDRAWREGADFAFVA